jgi:NADH-quinone oxidoreductase subunit F
MLVELGRILGPLPATAIAYAAAKLEADADKLAALARAHRLAAVSFEPSRLGICTNGPCAARGGNEVERVLREKGVLFEPLRCQGACDLGPIACYNRGPPLAISAARARSLAKADPVDWEDILSVEKPVHAFKTETRVAFANIFAKGSHQLATARRHGAWAPVESALRAPPEAVFEAVHASGLVGGEPDGRPVAERWARVREGAGPKLLVIDGLETEPGTSKDRILLERDPHLVLAGAVLCAYAVGATEAFLCVRGEYELVLERCRAAVDDATRCGLLGKNILGTGFTLPVRLRLGASSYFAREPARLVEALEGNAPVSPSVLPRPEDRGLDGHPTLVQNVETLASVPAIVAQGAEWYRALGKNGAAGVKIVSLGGDVKRPGNYEVPRGTPIRHIIEELGEGPLQGKAIRALHVGGAASAYLEGDRIDTPLDDAALGPLGACIGSGAVVAVTEKSCLLDLARREAAFFAREACGACPTCSRLPALEEAIGLLGTGPEPAARLEALLAELSSAGCPVGRRAGGPIASVLERFPQSIDLHRDGHCSCHPRKKTKA